VTKAILVRIDELQPHFNAYRVFDAEAALGRPNTTTR
jgi:hypothetical protein